MYMLPLQSVHSLLYFIPSGNPSFQAGRSKGKRYKLIFLLILIITVCALPCAAGGEWRSLEPGMELGIFGAPRKAVTGNSTITVLRFDTSAFNLKLLCAANLDSNRLTVKQWCGRHGLAAAINAGMYARDYSTNVGYMKDSGYTNNPRMRSDYKAVLAFNPVKGAGVPSVQIIDIQCQNIAGLKSKYNTMVQNLRMIDCRGKNVWRQQDKAWSCAALAMDKSGKILFLFSESPYSVHDFIDFILMLPLNLKIAMYLEGGGPASMYARSENTVVERYGIPESGHRDAGALFFTQALPNVIGVVRKNNQPVHH
jgi:uncharacterized protein YigE (DUF2233 family)